jgi:hypothetical protein
MVFVEIEGRKDRAMPALRISTYDLSPDAIARLSERMKGLYDGALA